MGAALFPGAPQLASQGIRMCLLSTAVANVVMACSFQIAHGVGGLMDPVVPILGSFFASFHVASSAETAIVAVPLLTIATGLGTWAAGRLKVGSIVRACPYAVFGGFIAGSGAQLIEMALTMTLPGFTHILDIQSWRNLLTLQGLIMCGPGSAAAVLTYWLSRLFPHLDVYLMPCVVICLTICFYGVLWHSGMSMDEARELGWFFDIQMPQEVDCWKVWTSVDLTKVHWCKLLSPTLLSTFMQVFCISFLTSVKNIYGTSAFTKTSVNIDQEIMSAGVMNTLAGFGGGCPSGIVISYSVAAHALGARGKLFSWMLAMISVVLFVFGDFVVAVLPKMVPACVVLWIGIILFMYYAWDTIGKISAHSHGIILVMVLIDLTFGCSLMIATGLFLAFLSTIRSMSALPIIRSHYTLETVRSDVLRPLHHQSILAVRGAAALVVRLEAGLLSYANAFKVLHFIESRDLGPGEFLIIDWGLVKEVCDSAMNSIQEMREYAQSRGFVLIFTSVKPHVELDLRRFCVPLDLCICTSGAAGAAAGVLASKPGKTVLLVKDCSSGSRIVDSTVLAVEFVEECFLHERRALDADSSSRKLGLHAIPWSLRPAWDEVAAAGLDASLQPALPVLVDMRAWLSGPHHGPHELAHLQRLAAALEEQHLAANEELYSFSLMDSMFESIDDASGRGKAATSPPLIWLLEGEVEHCWEGERWSDCVRAGGTEPAGSRRHVRMRLEKARLDIGMGYECIGPLRTIASFSGDMAHCGRISATSGGARVALLRRDRYRALLRESPEAADLLNIYLAKKQIVDGARFEQPSTLEVWRPSVSPF